MPVEVISPQRRRVYAENRKGFRTTTIFRFNKLSTRPLLDLCVSVVNPDAETFNLKLTNLCPGYFFRRSARALATISLTPAKSVGA